MVFNVYFFSDLGPSSSAHAREVVAAIKSKNQWVDMNLMRLSQ